jgi:glycogen synthase
MDRLLFVTPAFPPFPGGGERYVYALAQQLAGQGMTVTAVASTATRENHLWQGQATAPSPDLPPNLKLIHVPLTPFPGGWTGLLAWRKLMVLISMLPGDQSPLLQRMARRIPPLPDMAARLEALPGPFDLVHAFNISWEYPLLVAWQYARQRGLPFMTTPFMHFGTGHDRVARNSTMDHQRRLLYDADRVLVLTGVERDGLLAVGCRPERVVVVGGGVAEPPPFEDTAVPPLPTPYLLFIGRASQEKGAIHAAQAVLQLRQRGTAVTLALIGQAAPEFDRFYRRLTAEQQQWIRPLGILPETAKHALLQRSELLLLPSRTDSFGIVLLEAWQHGKPVIGANAGGIPGVIDDGENGLLVPYGDVAALAAAVHRLLADPVLSRQLGVHGRQKIIRQYAWPQVAGRTLAQYRAALGIDGDDRVTR